MVQGELRSAQLLQSPSKWSRPTFHVCVLAPLACVHPCLTVRDARERRRRRSCAVARSLRSGTMPRIGELRSIALDHAERPCVPAAAAERWAASNNANLFVHRGGGLRLMVLCGRCGSGLLASSSAWALDPDSPSTRPGHGTRETALGPQGRDF